MNEPATVTAPPRPPEGGPWAPLRDTQFRSLWLAFLGSQLVVWMNTVGAATVIATLGGSSTLIALVQTATSLPAVLLALLAGAVTDIVDRRRLLLATQSWMLASTAAAAILTLADAATPASILLLTFSLGAGMAASVPAFQSLTPELAGPGRLAAGVALNSVAINLARAVGPALAGIVIAAVSAGAVFAVEAAGVALIIAIVLSLRKPSVAGAGQAPEQVLEAMRAGARFVRFSPAVRAVLARALLFVTGASAFWALLPVVAFGPLDLGSSGLGVLVGCAGVGAITGATVLPRVRRRLGLDRTVVMGTAGLAAALAALALVREPVLAGVATFAGGAAWLSVLSTLNTAAQMAAPNWVRGRALAAFQVSMQGGLATGALVWGLVTDSASLEAALLAAGAVLLVSIAARGRASLAGVEGQDLSPAHAWTEPHLPVEPAPDDGPVLVTLEYRVRPEDVEQFVAAMDELGRIRRRDGAGEWSLYQDLEDRECWLETFLVDSWSEHLRQHERMTVADVAVERRAKGFHAGPGEPATRHLLAAEAALAENRRP
ncbi:MAG TPA: MFS transporter [Thermoleophilaceae bacterium]|nr:MFS transporter [Thermoleophilaceae bacterium]